MRRRADRKRNIQPNTWNLCTSRTHRAQFCFSELDDADRAFIWGYLIVAARIYAVDVALVFFAANHMHLLCKARIPEAVSLFHAHFKAQVARYIQRKHGLTGAIWGGRFHNQNLLDDGAQAQALAYILDHGMRDLLVARSDAWPLPHTLREACADGELRGVAWRRRVGKRPGAWRSVKLRLTPLDAWAGDAAGFRRFVAGRLEDRVAHHAALRAAQAEAHAAAVMRARAAGEAPGTVDLPTGRLRSIIRRHDHVPPRAKRSLGLRFKAVGPGADGRIRDALEAHRAACEAYDGTLCALAQAPGGPLPAPPPGLQWPTAIAAAAAVPVIARTRAEVFAASEPIPRGSGWAQAG
ncbi:MAG: hypothetical protein KC613_17005 [Myxococcales bacterium]|nr:hypothetical protein [Myxococcales bacterium]MCB9526030.1 hypothetical protein [Myxococcales bacterium]